MAMSERQLYVGVDCGTQSTKVVVVNGRDGRVMATGACGHELIAGLQPGHVEQHPEHWFEAMETALTQAFREDSSIARDVCGIGISGQQHGFVPLAADGSVIRPAKLWCDTSTAGECETIISRVGGIDRLVSLTGNGLPPGFTASKILWLKASEPENYSRLATVLLPHDYLNFRLTGRVSMECGDASGTGLLDVRGRRWCREVVDAIDPGLSEKIPALEAPDTARGVVLSEISERWGMRRDVVVAPGGGDNMMAAIGTGNVREGIVTVSLGTSGTIFAYSSTPVVDPSGEIAAFCDSSGGWLPLACTMNVTIATELVKSLFTFDNMALEDAVRRTNVGADGLLLIPYFEGERTPNVPAGTGVWFGANRRNNTPAHYARAAMEGATLGLGYGLGRFRELGITPRQIRLTGGGARSAAWRQICADVFKVPVVCLEQTESAAYGAAIQARWIHERDRGTGATIQQIAAEWVTEAPATRAEPITANVDRYAAMQDLQDDVSRSLRGSFDQHRTMIRRHFAG